MPAAPPITADENNLAILATVATALGNLRESLVFVGGCATGVLVTNVRAQPIRMTNDVDLVAHVASKQEYHALERQFEALGFVHDLDADAPICRWRCRSVTVDLMPTEPGILGFHNRWYPLAVESAVAVALPNNLIIKLVTAPVFLGTKLEAFKGRGKGDYMASHDLEDVITVIDGRVTLLEEVIQSPPELRTYLATEIRQLLANRDFMDALPGQLPADRGSQARVPGLISKLRKLSELA
jgi:predicted nucleotidyltransferase